MACLWMKLNDSNPMLAIIIMLFDLETLRHNKRTIRKRKVNEIDASIYHSGLTRSTIPQIRSKLQARVKLFQVMFRR